MFTTNPTAAESAAAARRRTRPISRPDSRNTQNNERPTSNASMNRSVRESSIISQRGDTSLGKAMTLNAMRGESGGKDSDGGVVIWTKNEKYSVSKLPALPSILKTCTVNDSPITATTDSTNGHALLLSHTDAYVWQYTTTHTIPHTLSFPLPRDESPSPHNPFPLGALVSPSANSTEPGLVVVMPMSGRIAYWDSVGSAVAEGLFTKKRGVEGKVSLVSGESVTAICNAEPAGFLLSLSSGRLAHLALRDLAGRPGISVTIMRGYGTGMMGGFLGALRAGSSRRDIVAVRAGKVLRMGEREIVVATARGNFSRWQVNRSGTYANIADVDLREEMIAAIQSNVTAQEFARRSRDQFVVVDATVLEEPTLQTSAEDIQMLVLASFMPSMTIPSALYALVSITFHASGKTSVGHVHVVKTYTTPLEEGRARPRLYLPKPCKTAFLVFSRAVVLVSNYRPRAQQNENDSMMEEEGSDYQGEAFEDVVDFRGNLNVETVGSGMEDVMYDAIPRMDMNGSYMQDSFLSMSGLSTTGKKVRNPGIMLIAKGAGVVRIETFDLEPVKKVSKEPVKVKSKIEQAVFYGVKEDNPLNFQGRKEVSYPIEEIEVAALEISAEILSSTSEYLPVLLPSLENHLLLRATHLRALAEHLRATFPPLSRETMWRLLCDAEKCEAARAVWAVRDARLRQNPDAGEGVLEAVLADMMETDADDTTGHDPTRTWFQRFVGSIDQLLTYAKNIIIDDSKKGRMDQLCFGKRDSEANDIVLGALISAWKFRVHSAKLYGMEGLVDVNGILKQIKGLTPPWTSDPNILQALSVQYEVSSGILKTLWGERQNVNEEFPETIERLAGQLVGLAEERYFDARGRWIKPLVDFGRPEKAYKLAEKWQDYRTLVELCSEELLENDAAMAELGKVPASTAENKAALLDLQRSKQQALNRLEKYFEEFGSSFAREMYGYLVEKEQLQTLMDGFETWHETYLTEFLRGDRKYAKLEWIHDVSMVAMDQEEDLWNKKVELSIGKLAKLAAISQGGVDSSNPADDIRYIDADLELVAIQEKIYESVKHHKDQIDTERAVQDGLETYAPNLAKKRPGCRELWKRAFGRAVEGKVIGVEEIGDLLTLVDDCGDSGLVGSGSAGEEFYWALKVLSIVGGLSHERRKLAERTIWRRCYLRDDWATIVSTKGRSDSQVESATYDTALFTTIKLGYEKGLFNERSPFQPLDPVQTYCNLDNPLDELKIRFTHADESELGTLAHEYIAETRQLQKFVNHAQLGTWFLGVCDSAKRAAMEDVRNPESSLEEDTYEIEESYVEESYVEEIYMEDGAHGEGSYVQDSYVEANYDEGDTEMEG
ncbi:uncharacterized protein H6S33_009663 [Morchella sextelata]|uniref:uncharacterized protein n=1 Tax=Morchella sextelata TaxID=1174677 RepID=UPI001D0572A7|nr:uncharacterized protein H6S33_009663 [Morchella sextelata]KAH0613283.1 hypothetical protein H6S33_009663 [Morchella sextelata]